MTDRPADVPTRPFPAPSAIRRRHLAVGPSVVGPFSTSDDRGRQWPGIRAGIAKIFFWTFGHLKFYFKNKAVL